MAIDQAHGARFNRTSIDKRLAEAITEGRLELPPHKEVRIPRDPTWFEDPFKDRNWVFQFHTLRWLDPLRRQAELGQPEFLDVWLAYAHSWIEKNPPGRGRTQFAWADMVDGARALTFSFALPAIEDYRPEQLQAILDSLHDHGEWLAEPSHIKSGNHALQQHQGLLVVGSVLQNTEWVELAYKRCLDMVSTAYDAEGMNEEGATQYHHMNFSWWNLLRKRFEIVTGEKPSGFDRIEKAPLGFAHSTRPDGIAELIGDTEEFIMKGVDHPAVEYVSSRGKEGSPPEEKVKVFDRGYVFGRSTWGEESVSFSDASFYSLCFGSQNKIHGHADGMSLTLFKNRHPLFIDSGKYSYELQDEFRQYFLSREAHNSLSVVSRDYDIKEDVSLEASLQSDLYQSFVFEDLGYEDVKLQRILTISLELELAIVIDSFQALEDLRVRQWWHLPPGSSHRREGSEVFVRTKGNSARMFMLDPVVNFNVYEGSLTPVQGWYSPSWRKRIPARSLSFEQRGTKGRITNIIDFSTNSEESIIDLTSPSDRNITCGKVTRPSGVSVGFEFTVFESAVGARNRIFQISSPNV